MADASLDASQPRDGGANQDASMIDATASDTGTSSDAAVSSDASTQPALCSPQLTCTWRQLSPAASPPPLGWPAMAYDEARDRIVLFGGASSITGGTIRSGTWVWDGSTWTELSPPTSPPARWTHGMVYDEARQRIVLFGGLSGDGPGTQLNDTWEWDGSTWTEISTANSPPARGVHGAMVYDSARERVILRGGGITPSVAPIGDTWEYDGVDWTEIAGSGPSARVAPGMVYDRARGHVVLFGGGDWNPYFGDTWRYDGTTWTELFPTASPTSRQSARMVYDAARSVSLLFGGDDGTSLNDLWQWDGSDWTGLSITGPEERCCYAFAHDKKRGAAILFGGGYFGTVNNETWSFGE
jgi:hypothetical protein